MIEQEDIYAAEDFLSRFIGIFTENGRKYAVTGPRLTDGLSNRPYMVIDDGWESSGNCMGPWTAGNSRFPDMRGLAEQLCERNVIPGIWFRPLRNPAPELSAECRQMREREFLDPSHPSVLERVSDDIRCLTGWGYRLLKHDFSTWDVFGNWGFQMRPWPAAGDWRFHDDTRTSAEIITAFYRTILDAAGDGCMILGCNTIGHLGAELMHLARTDDDTSGKSWERTCRMGVNTLAFRMGQNRTFFLNDADCVGISGDIPWKFNEQWGRLLASSGTAFFASIKPGIPTLKEFEALQKQFATASTAEFTVEPLDWMTNPTPEHWLIDGKEMSFDWTEPEGSTPDFVVS